MCNKDIAWVKERLRDIKCHAIEQTEFYKAYKVTDEFPVVNKMTLIENHDACLAKAGYQTPTHVSSTSGSTGTPFSVTQDFRKRNRTIADELKLKSVYGAFMYPLLIQNGAAVRKELQKERIYIPTLWPNVLEECPSNSLEYHYAADILPIPVDQRYEIEDMKYLVEVIKVVSSERT